MTIDMLRNLIPSVVTGYQTLDYMMDLLMLTWWMKKESCCLFSTSLENILGLRVWLKNSQFSLYSHLKLSVI